VSATSTDPRRAELASRFLVLVLAGIFLLGLLGFLVAVLDARDEPATHDAPSRPDPAASFDMVVPRIFLAMSEGAAVASASSTSAPAPTQARGAMPVVPVARFWSSQEGVSRRDLVRGLESGTLAGFRRLVIDERIADALAGALGITLHEEILRGDIAAVQRSVRRGALGLVAAASLQPALRPLAVDGRALVGNGRIRDATAWPLLVDLPSTQGATWEQSSTWVLVAGGDAFTDRGVYDTVVRKGRGVAFPFDGGTARVTGHGCCDPVFGDNLVPRYVLTGGRGAVRRLFREAELAIANHEMPTTDDWDFHASGLRFSGRPDLTRIFTRAGIDWLSLANNHIKDYGTDGILDTRRILRQHGLAFGGAGVDLEQARRVRSLEVRGASVALIPCVGVARAAWAGPGTSGGTPCLDRYLVPDIKAAVRRGDVVVVIPHWGVEYTRQPLPSMRRHAARWVKAGAALILGGHSHVAGAIEEIEGRPVLYSLGNLIFDQHWSTDTMESALLEATFHGPRLVALRLHPYLIHATSQPNLLDPATGEGRRLLRAIRSASHPWLEW
jgi:poly-gamma-glutamate capsule biosynthesis protein CapA/YwtB (metallophosphatase superfamily)